MNLIVQKYGGSSVKSKEALNIVCKNIIKTKETNSNVLVVVSAQGNTTNELISKAKEYTNDNITSKKDLDFLLSTGEMQTAALLSLMLNSKGYDSVCLNGLQSGIITTSEYGNAKITNIINDNLLCYLKEGKIIIITGFQGIDKFGNITTLGRGGSDLTAVAIASSLNANKCEIYSDIDGIFSTDPKVIENAKLLNSISYDEMIEASSNGAKVLHNRCVNLAKKYNLKIISKNTYKDSKGTIVQDISEDLNVHFITKKENLTKISIVGSLLNENSNVLKTIYNQADLLNVKIHMITINESIINLLVDKEIANTYMQRLHEVLIIKEE